MYLFTHLFIHSTATYSCTPVPPYPATHSPHHQVIVHLLSTLGRIILTTVAWRYSLCIAQWFPITCIAFKNLTTSICIDCSHNVNSVILNLSLFSFLFYRVIFCLFFILRQYLIYQNMLKIFSLIQLRGHDYFYWNTFGKRTFLT